jgi:hypothetical protein
MKKVLTLLVALSMIAMIGLAYADTININDQIRLYYDPSINGYSFGRGGAFFLTNSTGDDFYTFCVERREYFSPSNPYYVGGISDVTRATGHELTPEAAYIYWAYRNNIYQYPETGINQNGAIQEAIWFAMDDVNTFSVPGAQAIYADAVGRWSDIGNVRVLNLYSSYSDAAGFSGNVQDQLALVSGVPEPSTFLLLGAGLAGVGLLRRRFKS